VAIFSFAPFFFVGKKERGNPGDQQDVGSAGKRTDAQEPALLKPKFSSFY
jgi:hypothetical protein